MYLEELRGSPAKWLGITTVLVAGLYALYAKQNGFLYSFRTSVHL